MLQVIASSIFAARFRKHINIRDCCLRNGSLKCGDVIECNVPAQTRKRYFGQVAHFVLYFFFDAAQELPDNRK